MKIQFTECLPKDLENRRARGHAVYEASKGIACNYKKFHLLLEVAGEVVGILEAYRAFAEIYVEDLWVDEKHRNRGYGAMLLKELEKRLEGEGYHNINLVTSEFSAPEFYRKCGYQVEFVRENQCNPKLTKTFFIKFFKNSAQTKGLAEAAPCSVDESLIYAEEPVTKELQAQIHEGFSQHAIEAVGSDGCIKEYCFVARQKGEVMGAVVVKTFWGALHIKNLWVAESSRGVGVGTELMRRAMEKGRKLGCPFAFVETMSFQAAEFYKRLGFKEDFVRHGYAQGASFHYLQKNLAEEV